MSTIYDTPGPSTPNIEVVYARNTSGAMIRGGTPLRIDVLVRPATAVDRINGISFYDMPPNAINLVRWDKTPEPTMPETPLRPKKKRKAKKKATKRKAKPKRKARR